MKRPHILSFFRRYPSHRMRKHSKNGRQCSLPPWKLIDFTQPRRRDILFSWKKDKRNSLLQKFLIFMWIPVTIRTIAHPLPPRKITAHTYSENSGYTGPRIPWQSQHQSRPHQFHDVPDANYERRREVPTTAVDTGSSHIDFDRFAGRWVRMRSACQITRGAFIKTIATTMVRPLNSFSPWLFACFKTASVTWRWTLDSFYSSQRKA